MKYNLTICTLCKVALNWCLGILLSGPEKIFLGWKEYSCVVRRRRGGAEDFRVRHQIVVALWASFQFIIASLGCPVLAPQIHTCPVLAQQKYDFLLSKQKYGRFQTGIPRQLAFNLHKKKHIFFFSLPGHLDCNMTEAKLVRDEKWF